MEKTLVVLLFLFYEFCLTLAMENGFTYHLPPRKKECFYESLTMNTTLEPEYQVIEGGELDINFEILDPNGRQLLYHSKSSDEADELQVKMSGVYTFCMDNTFSTVTSKLVYFDLGIERDEWQDDNIDSVFKIYSNLEGLRSRLGKMSAYQGSFRAMEARQRYFVEGNNSRVVWVSTFASVVVVIAAMVQVYFVRRLFDTRSRTRI